MSGHYWSNLMSFLISSPLGELWRDTWKHRLNSPFRIVETDAPRCNVFLSRSIAVLNRRNPFRSGTSQLAIPVDAWRQVLSWIKDLTMALRKRSGNRDTLFVLDCNPSFAIYTQLALVAAENVVVPFTADDSSRRAVENRLGHDMGDPMIETYARISFAELSIPKLHTFVSNRITRYSGKEQGV